MLCPWPGGTISVMEPPTALFQQFDLQVFERRKLKTPGVHLIDLHAPMQTARAGRATPFSNDRVHPGDEGHLLIAKTILAGLGVSIPDEPVATIKADPLFQLVEQKRKMRSATWMKHIGYTREKTVPPGSLGTVESEAARVQEKIDALRRSMKPTQAISRT